MIKTKQNYLIQKRSALEKLLHTIRVKDVQKWDISGKGRMEAGRDEGAQC